MADEKADNPTETPLFRFIKEEWPEIEQEIKTVQVLEGDFLLLRQTCGFAGHHAPPRQACCPRTRRLWMTSLMTAWAVSMASCRQAGASPLKKSSSSPLLMALSLSSILRENSLHARVVISSMRRASSVQTSRAAPSSAASSGMWPPSRILRMPNQMRASGCCASPAGIPGTRLACTVFSSSANSRYCLTGASNSS